MSEYSNIKHDSEVADFIRHESRIIKKQDKEREEDEQDLEKIDEEKKKLLRKLITALENELKHLKLLLNGFQTIIEFTNKAGIPIGNLRDQKEKNTVAAALRNVQKILLIAAHELAPGFLHKSNMLAFNEIGLTVQNMQKEISALIKSGKFPNEAQKYIDHTKSKGEEVSAVAVSRVVSNWLKNEIEERYHLTYYGQEALETLQRAIKQRKEDLEALERRELERHAA